MRKRTVTICTLALQVLQYKSHFHVGLARPLSRVRDSTDTFARVTMAL